MSLIRIDPKRCERDGLCSGVCPVGLISPGPEGLPEVAADAAQKCVLCGHCISVCPSQALSLAGFSPERLTPLRKDLTPSPESVEQLLRSRRSTRNYHARPVERELVLRLIDSARYAPSGMNAQPVRWIVVEGREAMRRIAGLTAEALRRLPYFLGFLEAWEAGRDVILRGAPNLVVAHADASGFDHAVDCHIALTYVELAAHGFGVGTCWAGLVMLAAQDSPALIEALGVPAGHRLYGALMAGYPRDVFRRLPPRREAKISWVDA